MTDLASPPAPELPNDTAFDVTVRGRVMAVLLAHIPEEGDYTLGQVVESAMTDLLHNDPNLMHVFMHETVREVLHEFLRKRDRSDRGRIRAFAKANAFKEANEEYKRSGDASVFKPFEAVYVVNDNNTRRRVGEMTGADHLFVATRYQHSADRLLMLSAFHKQVAKAVGDQKTSDVLDEETYMRLYSSIVGDKPTATE